MNVSVIIVNYNTKQLLDECLSTVYQHTTDLAFEVIVVDNDSSDGSENHITKRFPQVRWINSGGNLGFGKANNLGAKYARGKYLFLLNSDTLLLNNAIKAFYDYAEAHTEEHIGVLGCWIVDKELKPNRPFGNFPSPYHEIAYLFGRVVARGMGLLGRQVEKEALKTESWRDVDYICGADMFIPKDVFEGINGFDPNFFMYYEETDLQYRLKNKGYVRRIIPQPKIIHLEGGSFKQKGLSFNRFMMSQRSYKYYINKHHRGLSKFAFGSFLCLLRTTVLFQPHWTTKERIKGYLSSFTA